MTEATAPATEALVDEATMQELIKLNEQRAATYGLLSRLYRVEVDQPLLDELRSMRFPAKTGNENVDEGYRLLATYLSNTWDNSVTDLAIDYVRVFIGHGIDAFSAAYPFESVYTSEKRLLMQDARDEVLAIYRANLLKKGEEWNDCEDHIALELEFMQVMSERTAKALKEGKEDEAVEMLKTQRAFVGQHLANWVPMFVSDIKYFSQTDLYIGAGELLLGFVQTEGELLAELLDGAQAA